VRRAVRRRTAALAVATGAGYAGPMNIVAICVLICIVSLVFGGWMSSRF
jgi:hypothetical protein